MGRGLPSSLDHSSVHESGKKRGRPNPPSTAKSIQTLFIYLKMRARLVHTFPLALGIHFVRQVAGERLDLVPRVPGTSGQHRAEEQDVAVRG